MGFCFFHSEFDRQNFTKTFCREKTVMMRIGLSLKLEPQTLQQQVVQKRNKGSYDSDAKYVYSSDDDMAFEKIWARKEYEEYDEMGIFLKTLQSSFW